MQLDSYFRNKKVFITGHTGFKGSWLLCWLHQLGAKIKGYALQPEHPEGLFSLMQAEKFCEASIYADIRDRNRLRDEMLDFEPDFVFHLAAQPLVLNSYEDPVYTHEVNINGTINVLESLRELKKGCVAVIVTTDKVYFNDESGKPYAEDNRLGGYDPYSASKAAAELVTSSYRNSFFNPLKYDQHRKSVSVVRAGNVIGGGDWSENRIIPDIIKALRDNEIINVRNPNAVRPWQHVLEPLGGYLKLAALQTEQPRDLALAFNFGPDTDDNLSVADLVNMAINFWGKGAMKFFPKIDVPHESGILRLDISLAKEVLKWQPHFNAKKAIEETLNWYKIYFEQPDQILQYTFMQITNFQLNR